MNRERVDQIRAMAQQHPDGTFGADTLLELIDHIDRLTGSIVKAPHDHACSRVGSLARGEAVVAGCNCFKAVLDQRHPAPSAPTGQP